MNDEHITGAEVILQASKEIKDLIVSGYLERIEALVIKSQKM
ncbi:MAG: hypothetical protein ACK5LM_03075 [Lactovum sp.]